VQLFVSTYMLRPKLLILSCNSASDNFRKGAPRCRRPPEFLIDTSLLSPLSSLVVLEATELLPSLENVLVAEYGLAPEMLLPTPRSSLLDVTLIFLHHFSFHH